MPDSRLDQGRSAEHQLILAGYRYALSLNHHPQDAEDLVQQACLKIYSLQKRIPNKAYLFKTIRNLFYDACRRRNALQFDELHGESLTDSSPNQTRVVDGRLDMATLLGTLTSEERELLYLNCVERFTAEEIGNISGKPRGTVLSQLSRAKQKVRQQRDPKSLSEEAV